MSKGIFDKRFRNHIPTDTAVHTLLCTNELGYVEADASYRIIGTPQKSILFGYTTDGAGMLQYKSVKYPLKSGSLFCIDCSNPHSYWADQGLWEFYWFHAIGDVSAPLFKSFKRDVLVQQDVKHFVNLWENLFMLAETNSLFIDMKMASIINNMFSLVFEEETHDNRMNKTEEFIRQNFDKKITIDDMAKVACISKYHFSRLFKESTGQSPYKYLSQYRIDKAKDLLISTNLSVNEIALRVGFDDMSSFFYLFKQHMHVSPLQFRKHYDNLFPI